jgi:pimeloyl-ACP methyl ester carboxylesterase
MSDSAWRETVPLVAVHHEVFTPIAIGHRGGPPVQRRPVTIWDVIDAAERYLDEHGLEQPHLAGNSMGGFVALELARRGRAESVSAFSPAGLWTDALREHRRASAPNWSDRSDTRAAIFVPCRWQLHVGVGADAEHSNDSARPVIGPGTANDLNTISRNRRVRCKPPVGH